MDIPEATNSTHTGFLDTLVGFLSALSLLATLAAAFLIVPSIGPGFYGGTALLAGLILLVQLAVFVPGVILPVAVQFARSRLRISPVTRWLFIAAICGLFLEIAALTLIPITGRC